ncbi:hypothetical protein VTI28DRAFT_8392 [Corynascus sepedonium]
MEGFSLLSLSLNLTRTEPASVGQPQDAAVQLSLRSSFLYTVAALTWPSCTTLHPMHQHAEYAVIATTKSTITVPR